MVVSIGVVAFNEEKVLDALLSDLYNQTYDKKNIELILVNSMSTDRTKEMFKQFANEHKDEYYGILVLDNVGRIQASGWNTVIDNFNGDVMVRIDAHASIPADFIAKNVEVIESGEAVSGGPRPNIIVDKTPFKETLLLAEDSMFGSSFAPYRKAKKRSYVNSLFHGMYKREVIKTVGHFDEMLGRTEDNEFHYRIRKAGYKICYDENIVSYQHARSSLKAMVKQKYGNGYWIGLTASVCPGCLSLFHFVPFCFVMAIIFTSVLALVGYPFFAILMWSLYLAVDLLMSIFAIVKNKFNACNLLLPFIFPILHISYGIGTIVGIIKIPVFRKKYMTRKA
ncbi:MAG: glycosyltransferase family 2 protein [Lachnospiraceae bacterium]|nr:glycosyltransferase family 2 protein [Lachnospiraceae bacterium]